MFDPDWNPSADEQAIARVYRGGQNKDVFIYRLMATGTLDEKIYQRQIAKKALWMIKSKNNMMENQNKKNQGGFKDEDIKKVFIFNENTFSDTHELTGCDCCKEEYDKKLKLILLNKKNNLKKKRRILNHYDNRHKAMVSEIETMNHFLNLNQSNDLILKNLNQWNDEFNFITFLFLKKTNEKNNDEKNDNEIIIKKNNELNEKEEENDDKIIIIKNEMKKEKIKLEEEEENELNLINDDKIIKIKEEKVIKNKNEEIKKIELKEYNFDEDKNKNDLNMEIIIEN